MITNNRENKRKKWKILSDEDEVTVIPTIFS